MFKMLRLAKNMLKFHDFHPNSYKILPPAGQGHLSAPLDPQPTKLVRFARSPVTLRVTINVQKPLVLRLPNKKFWIPVPFLDTIKIFYFRTSEIWQP